MNTLRTCPDCGAKPGKSHYRECDVECCSVCGGQRLQCNCKGHDKKFARWTGIWPGEAEAAFLGLWCKMSKNKGWIECNKNDSEALPNLNKFHEEGYAKYFFIKP
jgi:hypothetical protein